MKQPIRIVILAMISAVSVANARNIQLTGPGDSHIFEGKLCSEVNTSEITINGRAFDAARDRLSIYGNGSIVIADGWTDPLTVYTEPSCRGTAKVLDRDRYYRGELQGEESYLPEEELGEFDNNVRSFRLKRGFMCTLANNADGTGFSRVFIADDEDLVVDEMPEGLDFVATHMYWNSQNPYRLAQTITDLCRNTYGGRPMWITEWNNGAN